MSTFVYMTRCDGCGHCVDICPSDIMHIDENIRRAKNIEPNFCWECYWKKESKDNYWIDRDNWYKDLNRDNWTDTKLKVFKRTERTYFSIQALTKYYFDTIYSIKRVDKKVLFCKFIHSPFKIWRSRQGHYWSPVDSMPCTSIK